MLDRINKGEDVEQCLKEYPEMAELKPVLTTAYLTRKASAVVQPRPEFKESARTAFLAHVRAREYEQQKKQRHSFFNQQPRWITAAIAALLVIFLGSGMVTASSKSMPDDVLYPVKITVENVRLNLARSDIARAELEARFVDRRITEVATMAEEGQDKKAEKAAERLEQHLIKIEEITSGQETEDGANEDEILALRSILTSYVTDHPLVLEEAMRKSPPSQK